MNYWGFRGYINCWKRKVTFVGGGVKLLAELLRAAKHVELLDAFGSTVLHQLSQLLQRHAVLRRPPVYRRHCEPVLKNNNKTLSKYNTNTVSADSTTTTVLLLGRWLTTSIRMRSLYVHFKSTPRSERIDSLQMFSSFEKNAWTVQFKTSYEFCMYIHTYYTYMKLYLCNYLCINGAWIIAGDSVVEPFAIYSETTQS